MDTFMHFQLRLERKAFITNGTGMVLPAFMHTSLVQIKPTAGFEQRPAQLTRQHQRLMLDLMRLHGIDARKFRIARLAAIENGG